MDPLESYCPVCQRQILPKRLTIPVDSSQPHPPAPPPSSPDDSSAPKPASAESNPARRSKNAATRTKPQPGLVRGTGRVKPNGAIKRTPSTHSTTTPAAQPAPIPQLRTRTVIDQSPIPLYCSEECRLEDLTSHCGRLSFDYNPDRDFSDSPPLPPVPSNSLDIPSGSPLSSETDSTSTASSSLDLNPHPSSYFNSSSEWASVCPGAGLLAEKYGFPPPPPRPTVLEPEEPASPPVSAADEWQSGVMMASRRIKAALSPDAAPKRSQSHASSRERKPIPGWTDGSDAWRSSVYSFSPPRSSHITAQFERPAAYKSMAASPHRSTGVYSSLGQDNTPTAPSGRRDSTSSISSTRPHLGARSNTHEDLSKYPLSFVRRTESRSSISSLHPQSLPIPPRRREHSILQPGAEGKLLVPDVKLRGSPSASSSSYDGASLSSWHSASSRSLVRSPLSRGYSDLHYDLPVVGECAEKSESGSVPPPKRPTVETRSWSYDNVPTYPVMPMPAKKEVRRETRVVDGVPKVVEVEVEVPNQMKRLFLFPGKEVRS